MQQGSPLHSFSLQNCNIISYALFSSINVVSVETFKVLILKGVKQTNVRQKGIGCWV